MIGTWMNSRTSSAGANDGAWIAAARIDARPGGAGAEAAGRVARRRVRDRGAGPRAARPRAAQGPVVDHRVDSHARLLARARRVPLRPLRARSGPLAGAAQARARRP